MSGADGPADSGEKSETDQSKKFLKRAKRETGSHRTGSPSQVYAKCKSLVGQMRLIPNWIGGGATRPITQVTETIALREVPESKI